MIDSLLKKILDSIIDLAISHIWRKPPHLDVYAENGLLVFENNEDGAVLDVLVTSVANMECHIDVSLLDPISDQKAMEKAYAYVSRNGGEPHIYPLSGSDAADDDYRILISRVPKGISKYHLPYLETRKDSFAVFEVVFRDYCGQYWLKKPGQQPKRLRKRMASQLIQLGASAHRSVPIS